MTQRLGERLKSNWVAQGLSVRPGVAHEEIVAFETRHSVVLPGDLREYHDVADGAGPLHRNG